MPGMPSLSLKHLTRLPLRGAASHPAIICLHGRGSHEGDLISLAPYLDDRLLWISPRAPLDLMGGYEWYRLEGIGIHDAYDYLKRLGAEVEFHEFPMEHNVSEESIGVIGEWVKLKIDLPEGFEPSGRWPKE